MGATSQVIGCFYLSLGFGNSDRFFQSPALGVAVPFSVLR
ncbi:hypothetical protein AVDCRST_MAG92-1696 [uncultured Coleofasciculus sp.]|uniref:Uncharacterized protein n=1 Tax=uncultured Coleofasciculus sp. TaxID=1267456 RepID=A0A6J4I738_9CYAN|nr:hypothetical protein AVDCRST_MAG92-1696 [uncultured Coleofasciculus sp.]